MSNVIGLATDIEAKNKELNDKIVQQSGLAMQMSEAIKKFRADRKNALAQIAQMQGAVQAFTECLKRLSDAPSTTEEPSYTVTVEPEVQS